MRPSRPELPPTVPDAATHRPAGASRVTAARSWCFAATLCLAPAAFSLHFVSFLHAKEAVLDAGLLACLALKFLDARPPKTSQGTTSAILAVWLWLLCSALSVVVHFTGTVVSYTVEEIIRITILLLFVAANADLLAQRQGRRRAVNALLCGGVIVALFGLAQYVGYIPWLFPRFEGYTQPIYSVFGNQDLLGGYMAVLLPLALGKLRWSPRMAGRMRRAGTLCLVGLLCAAWMLAGARSAWLAGACGIGIVLLSGRAGRRRSLRSGLMLLVFAVLIGAASHGFWWERVAGTFTQTDVGGRARLWFWDGAVRMIAAHPEAGVGLGNYAYWSPYYQGEALAGRFGAQHFRNELHTEDAHCEPLQLIADTGIAGWALLVWWIVRAVDLSRMARRRRRHVPLLGAVAALFVFCLFNAGLHSAPHALLGLTLISCMERRPVRTRRLSIPGSGVTLLAGILLIAAHIWTALLPSYYLCAAEDAHLKGKNAAALYARALAHPWPNYAAQETCGIWLLEQGQPEEAYAHLLEAMKGRDTGRVHLMAAVAASRLGLHGAANQHAVAASLRWPDNAEARSLSGTGKK